MCIIFFLSRFKEGLKCLGLLPLMQKHPELFKELFMNEEKPLLARDVSVLFKAELPPVGSNRRVVENTTICFWRDWLIEVEGMTSYCGYIVSICLSVYPSNYLSSNIYLSHLYTNIHIYISFSSIICLYIIMGSV